MPQVATFLPSRRAELVAWPARESGQHLVRNRHTGETFQLGEAEHFLLARLDGCHNEEQLLVAFAERFGEPLSEAELTEFLELAAERNVLQPADADPEPVPSAGFQQDSAQPSFGEPTVAIRKPLTARLLTAAAAGLQTLSAWLQGAAGRIYSFRLRRLDFVPRSDDVFIVTYPRSGTTWMQMILYQLTTDGGMDFPHIAEYCPWFERSQRSARGFDTRPSPRLFKSHLSFRQIPKGPGKYIYVARDGKDVAVSCYHLCRRYNGYEGTFAEFFDRFLCGKLEFGSWFEHVRQWHAHRHDLNVLFLTYEELTRDLEVCVRRIIAFCGLEVPEERLPKILDRCRFSYMKQCESQFDPALETLWEQGVQLNSFLRKGRVGEGKIHLSREQEVRFDEAMHRHGSAKGISLQIADAPLS